MLEDSIFLEIILAPLIHLIHPADRMSLLYQFTALVVAIAVYVLAHAKDGRLEAAGLIRWLLPREVLSHPSCQVDFYYFVINRMLRAAIYGSVLFWTPMVAELSHGLFEAMFGPAPGNAVPSILITASMTLAVIATTDATLWYVHYLFHKIPFLWDYHKVHHSAEVMTPITAARMHPVEEMTDSAVAAITTGFVYTIFTYSFGEAAVIFTVFDTNVVLFLFFVAAFNLRHSHVWVRYPTWLQHIFICPAQHQIHHSKARPHWDKNMGFIFACWDWAAGTLYAPTEYEKIDYGLGTEEDGGTWHSLRALYFLPFRQSAARILGSKDKAPASAEDAPARADTPAE